MTAAFRIVSRILLLQRVVAFDVRLFLFLFFSLSLYCFSTLVVRIVFFFSSFLCISLISNFWFPSSLPRRRKRLRRPEPSTPGVRFVRLQLQFLKLRQHWVYILKGLIYILSSFPSSQYNLPADKNQKHDFWQLHPINQTRKQLRLVLREMPVRPR